VKKNKLHILISMLLLAVVLTGRVGIHIFHQHESSASSAVVAKTQDSSAPVLIADDSEADCLLCKLDSFQVLAIEQVLLFSFFLAVSKPAYSFLLTAFSQFSFFTKSRGPPAFASIS